MQELKLNKGIFEGGSFDEKESVLNANLSDNSLDHWIGSNIDLIKLRLKVNGALLIRGLEMQGSKKLERVLKTIFSDDLLEYSFRTTPRTKMRGRIYTSTEYHQDQIILLHNENAYSNKWPMNIAFYCVKPSGQGGATPIADSRLIYRDIPEDIKKEFEQRKLLYVRNYGDIDLPWSEVFQTSDKGQVEQYCQQNEIEYKWLGDNQLRTWQVNNAACVHPNTQEKIWFNQAHMFHISSLNADTQKTLLNVVGLENLPKNVYYADGSTIEDEIITTIRQVYEKHTAIFQWQEGDLLLLDNMLYAHGRQAFSGTRRILTGMAGSMNSNDLLLNK